METGSDDLEHPVNKTNGSVKLQQIVHTTILRLILNITQVELEVSQLYRARSESAVWAKASVSPC